MAETVDLRAQKTFGHLTAVPVDKAHIPPPTTDAKDLLSGQIQRYDPTQYAELSDWVIIRIFQEFYVLLMQFIGVSGFDSTMELRLYNELFRILEVPDKGTGINLNNLGDDPMAAAQNFVFEKLKTMSASQHEALSFLAEFCQNEKHLSADVKKTITETANWAKMMNDVFEMEQTIANRPFVQEIANEVERDGNLPARVLTKPLFRTNSIKADTIRLKKQQAALLDKTVEQIQNRITSLEDGQSTTISTSVANGRNHLLLNVTKTGSTYKLTILTKDTEIQKNAVIASGGKQKILPGVPYVGISENEFASDSWLKAFLMLACPAYGNSAVAASVMGGQVGSSKEALLNLFQPFESRVDMKAQPQVYKTGRGQISPISNVWTAIHGGPLMKVRMRLYAHYGFFSNNRLELEGNYMLCKALSNGNLQLRRDIIRLQQQDLITQKDVDLVSKQLDRIEKDIETGMNPKAPPPPSTMPTGYDLTLSPSSTLCNPESVKEPKLEKALQNAKSSPTTYDYSIEKNINRPELKVAIIDKNDPFTALNNAKTKIHDYIAKNQPLEAQEYFMQFIEKLPFEEIKTHKLDESPWHSMNPKELEDASKLLTELSQTIASQIRLSQSILPDRFFAMIKASRVIELLAHLNKNETGYKWRYHIAALDELPHFLLTTEDLKIKTAQIHIRKASPFIRLRNHEVIKKAQKLLNPNQILVKNSGVVIAAEEREDATNPKSSTWDTDYFHLREFESKASLLTLNMVNLPKEVRKVPINYQNNQNKNLKSMVELFDLFLPTYSQGYFEAESSFDIPAILTDIVEHRRRCAMFGRPIQTRGMLGAAAKSQVGSRRDDPMLEEALIYDPKEAYKRAILMLQMDQDRLELPKGINREDLYKIIKALDSRSAIIESMAVIENNPYLLQISDVRNAIEMKFLDPESIEQALKHYPNLTKDLPGFMKSTFSYFYDEDPAKKRQDVISALFVMHLSVSMKAMLEQINKPYADIPDFSAQLCRWAQDARQTDDKTSQIYEARSVIFTYWLESLCNKDKISEDDMKEILLFNAQLARSTILESDTDPVVVDKVKRLVATWTPAFEERFKDETFRTAFLEMVCQFFGKQIPNEKWSGTYPAFECDSYKVDLSKGYIVRTDSNRTEAPLSAAALSIMRCACPDLDIKTCKIERITSDKEIYQFKDSFEVLNQIEIDGSDTRYYKSMDGGVTWLQYKPREELFPRKSFVGFAAAHAMYNIFVNFNFMDAVKQIFSIFTGDTGIPLSLMGESQFVDVSNPHSVITFSQDGKPLFKLSFEKSYTDLDYKQLIGPRLKKIEDVRPEFTKANKGRTVSIAGTCDADFLKNISRFENLDEVLLWGQKGKLEAVELTRMGLLFDIEGKKLVCRTPKYDGYTLDLNPSIEDRKGIQAAILLNPPAGSKKNKKLLVTKSEDMQFGMTMPSKAEMWNATRQTVSSLFWNSRFCLDMINPQKALNLFMEATPLKMEWKIETDALIREYWEFEVSPLEEELRPPSEDKARALTDFILHAQTEVSESRLAPLRYLSEITSNLRVLDESDFGFKKKEDFDHFVKQLGKLSTCAKEAKTPEQIGLGLKTLLLLSHRLPPQYVNDQQKNGITSNIIDLFDLYLKRSKRCDVRVLLTESEEQNCFDIYAKAKPAEYKRIAPFYLKGKDEVHKAKVEQHDLHIGLAGKVKCATKLGSGEFDYQLANMLKFRPEGRYVPYRPFFLKRENIRDNFNSIYSVLSTAKVGSSQFKELETSLAMLSADPGDNDLDSYLVFYFKQLCAYRAETPDDQLPALPKVQFEKTKSGYSWNYFDKERPIVRKFFTDLDRRIYGWRSKKDLAALDGQNINYLPGELSKSVKEFKAAFKEGDAEENVELIKELYESIKSNMLSMPALVFAYAAAQNERAAIKNDNKKMNALVERVEKAFGHIKIDSVKDLNADDFNQLIKALEDDPTLIQEMEQDLPKSAHCATLVFDEVTGQLRANIASRELQNSVHDDIDGDPKALNDLSIKALENILTKRPFKVDQKIILESKGADALFKAEDLNAYFEDAALVEKLQNVQLDLSLSKESKEKAVQSESEKLTRCFNNADNALKGKKLKTLKAAKHVGVIKQLISVKHHDAKAKAETLEAKIKNAISFNASATDKAGYKNGVTWTELVIAFFRDELKPLFKDQNRPSEARIPAGVKEDLLRADLIDFFKHSLDAKRTDPSNTHSLYGRLLTMEKEKTTTCAFTCNGYYEMLTQERLYDPAKFPELLLTEFHLGFLFRDLQLEFAQEIQNNPALLKQAATGSGKTMAIMPMLALMLPNGTNLVTLKFLNPLLQTSLNHLGSVLEKFMRRKIVHITYNSDHPVEEGGKSVFEGIYKKLSRAILTKSIVVTDLASFVHLDEKLIALCENKNPDQLTKLEHDHIYYLAKISELRQKHEQCVFDEHDEALNINHKFLMRITDETTKPGAHIYNPIIELFDALEKDKELNLKANEQARGLPSTRDEIINKFADKYAADFATKYNLNKRKISDYFKAQNDDLLVDLDALDNPAARDYAALMKDCFSSVLPTALSKKGGSKYILANDGISVVPTELGSPGKPSERAIFDHPVVRMAYINMWYRQMGVGLPCLEKYLSEQYNSASRELAQAHASKNADITTMKQTQAGKRFQEEFGHFGIELSTLSAESKKTLLGEINKDPKFIRKFIEYVCSNTEISTEVTNASAHSLASRSRVAAGVSATQGCPEGYQKNFKFTDDARTDGERIAGESLRSLKSRFVTTEPILTYTPNCQHPEEIIKELKKQDPSIGILIDGSTDTSNAKPETLAQALKGDNIKKMMHWDNDGKMQVIGDKNASLDETGTLYSASQSRGADNPNSTAMTAVLLPNLNGRLEEAYQHVGRLRRRDHSAYMAVPKTWEFNLPGEVAPFKIDDIEKNPNKFVNHTAAVELKKTAIAACPDGATDWVIASEMIRTIIHNQWVENEGLAVAEELYKNRIERAMDEVRESAIRDLTAQASGEKDISKAAYNIVAYYHDTFKQNGDPDFVNPLVKKSKEVFRVAGEFYKQNKSVCKQDAVTVEVLKKNRDKCVAMLESCIGRSNINHQQALAKDAATVAAAVVAAMTLQAHAQATNLQTALINLQPVMNKLNRNEEITTEDIQPSLEKLNAVEEALDDKDPFKAQVKNIISHVEKLQKALNRHHNMKGAIGELKDSDKLYDNDKDKLPATVREADQSGDQAEIEVNTEQEAETTLNIDIEAARPNTTPSFKDWNEPYKSSDYGKFKSLHTFYDENLSYTQNFMPTNQNTEARFQSNRKAHDYLQKPLNFVLVEKDSDGNQSFVALDELDMLYFSGGFEEKNLTGDIQERYKKRNTQPNSFIVDLRRRVGDDSNICVTYGTAEVSDLIKAETGLVQLMVESGKVSGYTKREKQALERWLRKFHIDELEEFEKRYLLARVYEYKPDSKSAFPGSELEAIIKKCKVAGIGG